MSKNLEIVKSYWSKETAGDVDGVMEHFTEDATFKAPISELCEGADAVRQQYAAMLSGGVDFNCQVVRYTESGNRIAVEFNLNFTTPECKSGTMAVCNVFCMRDGKIESLRCYFAPSDLDV